MRVRCRLQDDVRGASLVEYLVLVGAIALVALVGFRVFGATVDRDATREAACVGALNARCAGGDAAAASTSASSSSSASSAPAASSSTIATIGRGIADFAAGAGADLWSNAEALGGLAFSITTPGIVYSAVTGKPNQAWEVAKGVGTLAVHPSLFADLYRVKVAEAKREWHENKSRAAGGYTMEAALLIAPFAKGAVVKALVKAGETAKVAEAASVAGAVDEAAESARAAEAASVAQRAEQGAQAARVASDAGWFEDAIDANQKLARLRRLGAARGFDSEPTVQYLTSAIARGDSALDFSDGAASFHGYTRVEDRTLTIGIESVVGRNRPPESWVRELTDHLNGAPTYAPKPAGFDPTLSQVLYGTLKGAEKSLAEHPNIDMVAVHAGDVVNQPLKRTLTDLGFVSFRTGEPLTQAEIAGRGQDLVLIWRRPPP